MANTNQYGILKEFDENSDDFPLYMERLEQFFKANAITAVNKPAIFLSTVGAKTYKLLRSLLQPRLPGDVTYDILIATLVDYFKPKKYIISERFKFYKRSQDSEEDVSSYVVELKQLASSCDFDSFLDQALRDRLVCGLRNEIIQRRLLTKRNISFTEASDIAISMELADRDTSSMKTQAGSLNVLQKRKFANEIRRNFKHTTANAENKQKFITKLDSKIKCYRCGANHYANACKHIKTVCNKCSKVGHLANVCRSSHVPKKASRYSANLIQKNELEEELEDLSLYVVNKLHDKLPNYTVDVKINGIYLNMIIDSAADTSTISDTWCKTNIPDVSISKPSFNLKDYNAAQVDLVGEVNVEVTCSDRSKRTSVTIVSGNKPSLFGKDLIAIFKPELHELLSSESSTRSSFALFNSSTEDHMAKLLTSYQHLFQSNNEPIQGFKANIKLKPDANPVFKRARPVPYALKPEVEKQIQSLEKTSIWERVEHSSWATPLVLVVKKDHGIRICGDFKVTVNPHTEPETYPLPVQKDLFALLNGKCCFSKIDLKQAYQQIQLDDKSRDVLTLNTHIGLMQPKRLQYGINNASQIFQSIMDKMLNGLPEVICYQDDILISTKSIPEHLQALNELFERLSKHNVHLNREKCVFIQDQIAFLGHKIDRFGIHPSRLKIEAIQEMEPPKNISELRVFIGMINYYAKFILKSSTLFSPLYNLLHKNVEWNWSPECEDAFRRCKSALTSDLLLVHYDHEKKLTLACDASPFGIGAVISHIMNDSEERPIAYASRTLTPAEKGYSHLEREALAIVFALKHFQQYLYGRTFTIITDHKPLISLFHPNTEIPAMAAARIQRWALLLSAFRYQIEYRKGSNHCNVDALSRFPLPNQDEIEGKCFLLSFIDELPLTASDIKLATRNDKILGKILHKIKYGWKDEHDGDLLPYYRRRDQLSIEGECLLWGMRVIIPLKLRHYLLDLLHDTHQGSTKMKSIARSHIWWPNLDSDIEQMSRDCESCQQNQRMPSATTLQSWIWPKHPWDRVHVDFAQRDDKYFFIMVDAHSKWIDVIPMSDITTRRTIASLRETFSRYGIPLEIVSDNGPQFTSFEFKSFMLANGIRHTLVPPYHPSSNGAAERSVQSFKSALKRMDSDSGDNSPLNHKISRYLLVQHTTPHSTTGVTPGKLFLGRELRTRWTMLHTDMATQVEMVQNKQKLYHDRVSSTREMMIGDDIYIRNMNNKPKWNKGVITEKQSNKTWTVLTDKGNKTCHIDQMRPNKGKDADLEAGTEKPILVEIIDLQPVPQIQHLNPIPSSQDSTTPSKDHVQLDEGESTFGKSETQPRRNPIRNRKPPDRLNLLLCR